MFKAHGNQAYKIVRGPQSTVRRLLFKVTHPMGFMKCVFICYNSACLRHTLIKPIT
jgi:hypothetical protein